MTALDQAIALGWPDRTLERTVDSTCLRRPRTAQRRASSGDPALAAGHRRWSMRVLVALPIAAVVPLMAYLALEPAIATRANPSFASSKLEFLLGTMAGIPAVSYAAIAGWAIVRRRWKALGILAVADAHHIDAVRRGMDRDRQQVDAGDRAIWHIGVVSDRVARRLCNRLARDLCAGASALQRGCRNDSVAKGWLKGTRCQ